MTADRDSKGNIKSNETLFSIIEYLLTSEQAGVTELADYIGKSKSTVHKHLQTLLEHGYVVQQDDEYRLGLRFLTVGGAVRDRDDLSLVAREHLETLASKTDQLVAFSLKERHYGYFVLTENTKYMIQRSIPLGTRFHLHQNSAGKAMLSQLDDEEIDEVLDDVGLPPATEHTITDPEELFDELETVRDRGYSINLQERVDGFWGVSAPVQDTEIGRIGAFSIAGPADENTTVESITDEYVDQVLAAANELRLNLKYRR